MTERADTLPTLVIDTGNLPAAALALRDLFAAAGCFFDRDMPVNIVHPADGGSIRAIPLTVNNVVMEAHRLSRPTKRIGEDKQALCTLPERVARMYLDLREWNLPPLAGISTAPLLDGDGSIRDAAGYDAETGLWCCRVPPLQVFDHPSRQDAVDALRVLRQAFQTFPFADAVRRRDPLLRVEVIDLAYPPGCDESAFLAALLTAICRASLRLAPGFLVVAPQVSGAGSGKGLLVRAITTIAFGCHPSAFTAGHDRQELDKRLVSELIEAAPAVFLDNVNGAVLRSETLASVMTERPARVRELGKSRMVTLNSTAFVAITGNGLRVSLDLVRRFLLCELDAGCEDPETRDFAPGFLEIIEARRAELLSAALTIWRYGRQHGYELKKGRPLGSFEDWCAWVRDPLLTLGCRDPVERVEVVKARDPNRQQIAELFRTWNECHGEAPVKAAGLAERVRRHIDPQDRGRQYVASRLGSLAGTRAAGFVLTGQEAVGEWGATTYALRRAAPESDDVASRGGNGIWHRDHRDHRPPMPPMPPMPDDPGEPRGFSSEEEEEWTA
jgi:hypothetical protein